MPASLAKYYPPDAPEAKGLDQVADAERQERKERIDRYWRYYDGKHDKPLKVTPGKRDDNQIINLASQAIDKLVAFFVGPKAPQFQLPNETPQPGDESQAQQKLDAFWKANDLESFITDLALAGFVSGHPFIKLLPLQDGQETPEIAVLDTRHVTVFWDALNAKRALWYRLQWTVSAGTETERRQDILPAWILADQPQPDPTSPWVILEYERDRNKLGGKWQEIHRADWAYPFAPILHRKNAPAPHKFYGESDLKHIQINDGVNFVVTNTGRIIKRYAQPTTVAIGANMDKIKETSIDGVWELPPGADLRNVEMSSDLGSSLAFYSMLRAAFFTQMRVVDWATQADKVGQLTNFGLRVLFADMLDNVNGKRRVYGDLLCEASQHALLMMGEVNADKPTANWMDPLPKNRLEMVQAATLEAKLGPAGASPRTLATELGRDYDQEKKFKEETLSEGTDALADVMNRLNTQGFEGGSGGVTALNNPARRTLEMVRF